MPSGRLAEVKGLPVGTGIGQVTILISGSALDCSVSSLQTRSNYSPNGLLCVGGIYWFAEAFQ